MYENRKLRYVRDSAGERLGWTMMKRARIKCLLLENPVTSEFERIRCFDFNENDELVQVRDCVNNALRYEYANHLLVRETDRIGFSFYFRYDNEGWCRETWGDGRVLYRNIDYDRPNRRTRVCNSEGHITLYCWNENGLVETEIDSSATSGLSNTMITSTRPGRKIRLGIPGL